MHLVLDQFLPWYAAVSLFGLTGAGMRPLRVPAPTHPLWGTCDFIRQEEARGEGWAQHYPRRCDANVRKWLPVMLPGHDQIEETGRVRGRARPGDAPPQAPFADGAAELRCFPHAVAGVGPLSDHCLRSHGWAWDPGDRTLHDCNQGRGWLLWAFRGHTLAAALRVGSGGAVPPPPPRHKIALFTGGHRAARAWHTWSGALRARFANRGAEVWPADLATMSAARQIELVTQVTVCVAAMGGNALTALFLPRGAGLILVTDGNDRLDWDLWGHASWLRVTWLRASDPSDKVVAVVARELDRYEAFRPRSASSFAPLQRE